MALPVGAGGNANASDINAIYNATMARPLARAVQSVAQAVASGVNTPITFTTEDFDTHGVHDNVTNNSRFTPTVAGYYRLTGTFWLAAPTALISHLAAIAKNGANQTPLNRTKPVASSVTCSVATTCILTANGTTDYFELIGNQTSTGAVAINTSVGGGTGSCLEMEYLRPL